MFQSARLKLTMWYVVIIMTISALFSITIFSILHQALLINEKRVELRLQRYPLVNPELLQQIHAQKQNIEESILLNLLYVNFAIFVVSSFAGYFLAGKTLRPIQRMVEEQNQFIADASHELRTPLTALRTGTEVALRDKKLSLPEAKKLLEENLGEVKSLQSLSDNLLSLAKFQYNHTELNMTVVSIMHIIQEAKRKMEPLAKNKHIEIHIGGDDKKIAGYPDELVKLFVIFFDNAIKYSPENTMIDVQVISVKYQVQVSIADHGVGIDAKDLPHIFDRFYRADKSRGKHRTAGYGLGLSIAKNIIDLHKGTVEAKSDLNKGSTFTVKFPRKRK